MQPPHRCGAHQPAHIDHPLDHSRLRLRDRAKTRLDFTGRWRGTTARIEPAASGAVLRVMRGTEFRDRPDAGDSGPLRLRGSGWSRRGRTWRFVDQIEGGDGALRIGRRRHPL
jgi:hypothetical protein